MAENELSKVVEGGYCIGCGACAAASPENISVIEDEYQQYQAKIRDGHDREAVASACAVCPFSNQGLNEDEISDRVFDKSSGAEGAVIGYYRSLYAGHVVEDKIRDKATSGGIITWTLAQLLERDLVDAVIHIKESDKEGTLFEYGFSRTKEEVIAGAKSRYYPVEMSEVMDFVKKNEGRYVFVGLPCFVKAARNLCIQDPVVGERIHYFVGLVCGHLKSKAFADLVGWQAGITPGTLKNIDFRNKIADRPANNYGIRVDGKDGKSKVLIARDCLGTNWGHGFFKYEACDYCDDIFSESADLAVGDAWLKEYTPDSKGNSVVITRNEVIDEIVTEGLKGDLLNLDELSADVMREAQGGGFRHRRSGLGYRLYLKQKKKLWAPKKRVEINKHGISFSRKLVLILRVYLRDKSAQYWKECRETGDYASFEGKIRGPSRAYGMLLKTAAFGKSMVQLIKKR